jgi:HKD family nuclease
MKNFYVIEGEHTDPNQIQTILKSTKKKHGPFEEQEANMIAKGLIQKNIDDFYHRAWVVGSDNLTK